MNFWSISFSLYLHGHNIFVFMSDKLKLTLISQWKPSLKYSSIGGTTGSVLSVSVSDFWIKYNKCHKTIVSKLICFLNLYMYN